MNREIKFRAWDTQEKEMLHDSDILAITGGCVLSINPNDPDSWICEDNTSQRYINMQFTGLKDKSGQEIYEGDIVKRPVDGNKEFHGEWSLQEVSYRNGAWVVSYLKSETGKKMPRGYTAGNIQDARSEWDEDIVFADSEFWSTIDTLEVVGNIYENPELIDE